MNIYFLPSKFLLFYEYFFSYKIYIAFMNIYSFSFSVDIISWIYLSIHSTIVLLQDCLFLFMQKLYCLMDICFFIQELYCFMDICVLFKGYIA